MIVARDSKDKELASVPPTARKTSAWEGLDAALPFLHTHDAEAGAEVERWLLRSLPVPRAMLAEVWADEAWCSWFTNLVVTFGDDKVTGFLRATDLCGLGVVDLDGESVIIIAERALLPHPMLPANLGNLCESAVELGIKQHFNQLSREVHRHPDGIIPEVVELTQHAEDKFEQLHFAADRVSSADFEVPGSYATCLCFEDGEPIMARYWTGARPPEYETVTGDLHWVRNDRIVPVAEVGPLAYSEGVYMTAYTFAGRKVKADKSER